jgi:hypothetical protein
VTDQELRDLIRGVVARKLADQPRSPGLRTHELTAGPADVSQGCEQHASHGLYVALVNVGDACVIEPTVSCTHCNYCKSHGH